jgi:hypothetical protein
MKKVAIILVLCLTSCFIEPKKANNKGFDTTSSNVDTTSYIKNNIIDKKPLKIKKFIYVVVSTKTPILRGNISEMIDIRNSCYIDFEYEVFSSDIVEVQNYNEDVKNNLIDEAESEILEKNQYVSNSLYSNAVVTYGYEAAEHLKNNNYRIKVTNSKIFTFDSYSEASISKKKRKK